MTRAHKILLIYLNPRELKAGSVLRSMLRVGRFYRIGEERKAIDNTTGYSFGVRLRILDVVMHDESKVRVLFEKVMA